jgi:hypothetical protein
VITPAALAPDATPAQRAWSALHFIKLYPERWDQGSYGTKVDGELRGCLAFHIVRMAGYEVLKSDCCPTCWTRVRFSDLAEPLAGRVGEHCASDGLVSVERLAQVLLGNRVETLFRSDQSLLRLEEEISCIFGPDPIGGVEALLDRMTDAEDSQ